MTIDEAIAKFTESTKKFGKFVRDCSEKFNMMNNNLRSFYNTINKHGDKDQYQALKTEINQTYIRLGSERSKMETQLTIGANLIIGPISTKLQSLNRDTLTVEELNSATDSLNKLSSTEESSIIEPTIQKSYDGIQKQMQTLFKTNLEATRSEQSASSSKDDHRHPGPSS